MNHQGSVQDAQALINKLSKEWNVPPPTVEMLAPEFHRLRGMTCYYSPSEWTIVVRRDWTDEDITHEFRHYLIHILKVANQVEERLANNE